MSDTGRATEGPGDKKQGIFLHGPNKIGAANFVELMSAIDAAQVAIGHKGEDAADFTAWPIVRPADADEIYEICGTILNAFSVTLSTEVKDAEKKPRFVSGREPLSAGIKFNEANLDALNDALLRLVDENDPSIMSAIADKRCGLVTIIYRLMDAISRTGDVHRVFKHAANISAPIKTGAVEVSLTELAWESDDEEPGASEEKPLYRKDVLDSRLYAMEGSVSESEVGLFSRRISTRLHTLEMVDFVEDFSNRYRAVCEKKRLNLPYRYICLSRILKAIYAIPEKRLLDARINDPLTRFVTQLEIADKNGTDFYNLMNQKLSALFGDLESHR